MNKEEIIVNQSVSKITESNIENNFCNMKITDNQENDTSESKINILQKLQFCENFNNFTVEDLYKYTLKFYREKSGKAIHLSYSNSCYLVALSQQVKYGAYNPATSEPLGVLDIIGRDRRQAWQSLGEMDSKTAMVHFIEKLNELTTALKPYIEATVANIVEKERLDKENAKKLLEEKELHKKKEEELQEMKMQETTKRQIQDALNQQTFAQFKSYAEQQFPGNPEQQGVLVKQLQEQHYQQYMQQVYQYQLFQSQNGEKSVITNNSHEENLNEELNVESSQDLAEKTEINGHLPLDLDGKQISLAAASMWTRRDIKEFKDSIKSDGGDSIIKIGHGETVTVRVPTHENGTCLFWEFATDSYDLGFGVFFEFREDAANTGVTVLISESDSEEDVEDESQREDIEKNAIPKGEPKPPQSTIIPVYRRDCHEEVYSGSHPYPARGVYLLKFDNSYSLWRSKVLYYRVYYTQK